MSAFRLAAGGRIDRTLPLRFTFDGKSYEGFAGDTLASALLANGVHLVGRSFKYHRPRGILRPGPMSRTRSSASARGSASPPICAPRRSSSMKASWWRARTAGPRSGAISARSTICSRRFFPAGFYYKTFMWPKSAWKRFYEPRSAPWRGWDVHRRSRTPTLTPIATPIATRSSSAAGPAGIAAALAAEAHGARVILCDEQAELGGSLLSETQAAIDGKPAPRLARRRLGEIIAIAEGAIAPAHHRLRLFPAQYARPRRAPHRPSRGEGRRPPARAVVAGSSQGGGARDGRNRAPARVSRTTIGPGIMLADAARQTYRPLRRKPGSRAVVATAHEEAYRAALDLAEAGVEIAAILDLRARSCRPMGRASARRRHRHPAPATFRHGRRAPRVQRRHRALRADGKVGKRSAHRLRPRADVRRFHAEHPSVLPIARQAALFREAECLSSRHQHREANARPALAAASSASTRRSRMARPAARGRRATRSAAASSGACAGAASEDPGGGRLEPLPHDRSPNA